MYLKQVLFYILQYGTKPFVLLIYFYKQIQQYSLDIYFHKHNSACRSSLPENQPPLRHHAPPVCRNLHPAFAVNFT